MMGLEKKYTIDTQFVFSGTFTVTAKNEEQARNMIEEHCGLVLGGKIHSTLSDRDVDWDFNTHPATEMGELLAVNGRDPIDMAEPKIAIKKKAQNKPTF